MADSERDTPTTLYERWLFELLGEPIPCETTATCEDCVMLPSRDAATTSSEGFFQPTTKCCTFQPDIPNFLVGALFATQDRTAEPGRRIIRARINERSLCSPLGVRPTLRRRILAEATSAFFGRAESMRCPYYVIEEGRCGLWLARGAVCSTWFCKHDRGARGARFWGAARRLLQQVERELSLWCLLELGGDHIPISALLASTERRSSQSIEPRDIDDRPTARGGLLWSWWDGTAEELFLRCHALIEKLSWSEVALIGGPRMKALARQLEKVHAELGTKLPKTCAVKSFSAEPFDDACLRITTYSPWDPLEVPVAVIEALARHRDRPCAEILDDGDALLDRETLQVLFDFGVVGNQDE